MSVPAAKVFVGRRPQARDLDGASRVAIADLGEAAHTFRVKASCLLAIETTGLPSSSVKRRSCRARPVACSSPASIFLVFQILNANFDLSSLELSDF